MPLPGSPAASVARHLATMTIGQSVAHGDLVAERLALLPQRLGAITHERTVTDTARDCVHRVAPDADVTIYESGRSELAEATRIVIAYSRWQLAHASFGEVDLPAGIYRLRHPAQRPG